MLIDQSFGYDKGGHTQHVENIIDTRELSHGKYNCGMAVYLDMLAGVSGEDEWTGNSDLGESCLRFGRWLVSYDSQGFIEAYKYPSVEAAKVEFTRIDLAMNADEFSESEAFDEDDWEDGEEAMKAEGTWECQIHPGRTHEMGGDACRQFTLEQQVEEE